MKKRKFDLKKYWDSWIVLIFLVIRLVINIESKALSIGFAIVYAIFILMLFFRVSLFVVSLVLFLTIDSMIGTYLFATGILGQNMFYGTMIVNFIIIIILIQDFNKTFKK